MIDSFELFIEKILKYGIDNVISIYNDFYGDYTIEETQNLEDRLKVGL